MATIKFIIQSKNNPAGIYVRLKEGRQIDAKAKTKFVINPSDWSNAKGQPKNLKQAHLKQLNEDLESFQIELLSHYNRSEEKSDINSHWLKEFINPPPKEEEVPEKLLNYIEYYSLNQKSVVLKSTYKQTTAYKNLIDRFQIFTKKEWWIKDINYTFKLSFEKYCTDLHYGMNYIAKIIKFIKGVCTQAKTNGIATHLQLDSLKSRTEEVGKVFLSEDEIEKIKDCAIISSDHLLNARDWLLISCCTGQRVSDFMHFTHKKIEHKHGVNWISFKQIKTKKLMSIPLSATVMGILEKRDGNFPRKISAQKYNDYIKEVCKLSEIDEITKGSKFNKEIKRKKSGTYPKYELVTSHIGRRSFATNNYGKTSTSTLIHITGHSTEKMFLQYVGKTDNEKEEQIAKYFKTIKI